MGGEERGALGNRDHPLIRDQWEAEMRVRGQSEAGSVTCRHLGLGLAMIENHDPPLGKEQLDIRIQESRQNSARIEI